MFMFTYYFRIGHSWSSQPGCDSEAIAALFRKKHDISLADLAALAALLENMVHSEADVRLAAGIRRIRAGRAEQCGVWKHTLRRYVVRVYPLVTSKY